MKWNSTTTKIPNEKQGEIYFVKLPWQWHYQNKDEYSIARVTHASELLVDVDHYHKAMVECNFLFLYYIPQNSTKTVPSWDLLISYNYKRKNMSLLWKLLSPNEMMAYL